MVQRVHAVLLGYRPASKKPNGLAMVKPPGRFPVLKTCLELAEKVVKYFLIRLVAAIAGSCGLVAPVAASALNWGAMELVAIDGKPLPGQRFSGKVVLVVNTASLCGFTPQYRGLQALWERYRDQGLVVLGVPSNDFGAQEPGGEAKIKDFCEANFGITFPMTTKQTVRGPSAHALYRWARTEGGSAAEPGWNFHKLLIGRDGSFLAAFPSRLEPTDPQFTRAVEAALR
jgi:glutathione peroxidase